MLYFPSYSWCYTWTRSSSLKITVTAPFFFFFFTPPLFITIATEILMSCKSLGNILLSVPASFKISIYGGEKKQAHMTALLLSETRIHINLLPVWILSGHRWRAAIHMQKGDIKSTKSTSVFVPATKSKGKEHLLSHVQLWQCTVQVLCIYTDIRYIPEETWNTWPWLKGIYPDKNRSEVVRKRIY